MYVYPLQSIAMISSSECFVYHRPLGCIIWILNCQGLAENVLHCIILNLVICISDLVPREAVEKWLKYLREELPTVAFKCSTQEQKANLGWKSAPKAGKTGKANSILQTSDCLGAETLIKLLKNYSRSHEVL